jgi:hypothetical protein
MNSNIEKLVRMMVEGTATQAARAALVNNLSSDEQKQVRESFAFISFADATRLIPDPFKHSNENQKRPDIRTSIDGLDYYFELGEITDEAIPRGVAHSIKAKTFSGCAFSQDEPLAKMLKQKCAKKYETGGSRVDLLLYYWIQSPFEETIDEYLLTNSREIEELFQSSQFDKIWIYDCESRKVLWMKTA